jgi:putative PIN family toxin of toxin-antitoxin system
MIRVVIDTNVLVSALVNPNGAEAAVMFSVADKGLAWCVSPPILSEHGTVLHRRKFTRLNQTYIAALLTLAGDSELLNPSFSLALSPHESDNRFYECARAARADYIVTGHRRHFQSALPPTKIVNARQLLDSLKK